MDLNEQVRDLIVASSCSSNSVEETCDLVSAPDAYIGIMCYMKE